MFALVSGYSICTQPYYIEHSTYNLANPYFRDIPIHPFGTLLQIHWTFKRYQFWSKRAIYRHLKFFFFINIDKKMFINHSFCIFLFGCSAVDTRVYCTHDKIKYPFHCKWANRHARFCYTRLIEWVQIQTINFSNIFRK